MSITYVTAFLDLKRDQWATFNRKFDEYLQSFLPYLSLLEKSGDGHNMLIYLDINLIETVSKHIPEHLSITIIPISFEILKTWPAWTRYQREKDILESNQYKTRFAHRLRFPENNNALYTTVTHTKVDFMVDALSHTTSDYICWVDFGYFKIPEYIPKMLVDYRKMDTEKVNLVLINDIDEKDKDIMYTMDYAPEKIGAYYMFGRGENLRKFQQLYHEVHIYFQELNLVDDEQHLMLQCYFRNAELFKLHTLGGWHKALKTFQLNPPKERIFIGDSHILCFEHTKEPMIEISGSSIHGLINPNSKSGARNSILTKISTEQYKNIVFMFGKVDLEWVYPYKKTLNPNFDINEWIHTVTREYKQFLSDIRDINSNITVLGIHPPSLDTGNMIKRINSQHSINCVCKQDETTTQIPQITELQTLEERTQNVVVFNNLTQQICRELDITYLVPPNDLFGNNGLVHPYMMQYGDHHLHRIRAGESWLNTYPHLFNRKRVAILICGHLRSFCPQYISRLKEFMQGANCDIFVSSHYTSDHSSYTKNRFSKVYSRADFDILFRDLPVRDIFVDSDQHPDNDKYNYCWKMWRKVNDAWNMSVKYAKENGINYDYVVRTRPDILTRELPDWDKLPPLDNNLIIGFGPGLGYPDDIFAIGSPKVMEHYCDIQKVIDHQLLPHKVVEYTLNKYPEFGRCLTSIIRYNDRIEKFYAPILTDFGNGMFELGHEKSYIGIGTPFACK